MGQIAVLGAGISGLVCAYRLAQAGRSVVVFEAGDTIGGLGSAFHHDGVRLDRFYHIMLDSDAALIALIGELGGASRMRWAETGMGIHAAGRLYPMNGPLDLLRFSPLSPAQRARMAFGAAYLTRVVRDGRPLDDQPAAAYLRRIFGESAYRFLWEPMLRAKFGEFAEQVPAYWIWSRLNREKKSGPERKGYPDGGYQWIADELAHRIRAAGGEIRLNHRVTEEEAAAEPFDAVISTLPDRSLRYMGVVNTLVISRQRLQPYYWAAVIGQDLPFQGIVETTHVIPTASTGGRHLVYTMNYCQPASATYTAPDEPTIGNCLNGLASLYPGFRRDAVEAAYVFRAPHVEPVWPLGYLNRRPPFHAVQRLFHCKTSQLYPAVNAWNSCVAQANTVSAEVARFVIR